VSVVVIIVAVWLVPLLVSWLIERFDQRRYRRLAAACQCSECRRKKAERIKYTRTKAYKKWSRYVRVKPRRRRR
jgi:hypothetical protein